MKNAVAGKAAVLENVEKQIMLQEAKLSQACPIFALPRTQRMIDQQQFVPERREAMGEIRADEAGGAGDDEHGEP